jgi:hypothetical protein
MRAEFPSRAPNQGWGGGSQEYKQLEASRKELRTKQRVLVKQQKLREESRIKFGQIHLKRLLREQIKLNRHLNDAQERNREIVAAIDNNTFISPSSPPPSSSSSSSSSCISTSSSSSGMDLTLATQQLDLAKRAYAVKLEANREAWKAACVS